MTGIYRAHGLRGLYFGGLITSVRDSIGYGFYFWGYEGAKLVLLDAADSDRVRMGKMLSAGGIAGCITWASVYPLGTLIAAKCNDRYCQNEISNAIYVWFRGDKTFDFWGEEIYVDMALHQRYFSARRNKRHVQRDGNHNGASIYW